MTPKELEKLGRTMFMSKYWKSILMRQIDVSRKTVNRWWTGENGISDEYEGKILKLLIKQYEALGKLVEYYRKKGKL